ncbi:MAG: tubulin beta chain [Promethearchaeota archaeon]
MAGEIVAIQVGQAGNQIAGAFWRKICKEHGIDPINGKALDVVGDTDIFFNKIGEKYIPRAVVVDLEPAVVQNIREKFGTLFDPKSIVSGTDGAGNNFAIGFNQHGQETLDKVMQVIEQRVAETESIGGFIFTHSCGGGTGSGFGSKILKTVRERYPKVPIFTFSIFPSQKISETVVEPYNTILTLSNLIKYASASVVLDNEALFAIAQKKLEIENPSLEDLNLIIAQVLTNVTASLRFSGTLNLDLGKLVTNLVPFDNLHFLMTSTSPLVLEGKETYEKMTVQELSQQIFNDDYICAACKPSQGKYLAASVLFRGDVKQTDVNDAMGTIKEQNTFVNWIPTGFKISRSEKAPANSALGLIMMANNSEIAAVFEHTAAMFDRLWSRKAFAHWYTDAGFEEKDLEDARALVQTVIDEYKNLTEEA